jgi:Flp pilus assembly pilin Flp
VDRGASLIEYALLISLIAVACVAAIAVFGGETGEKLSQVGTSVAHT